MPFFTPQQRQTLLWFCVGIALLALLWLLSPVLGPFVGGVTLAYMLNPGVERLARLRIGRWQMPRWVGAIVMIVLLYSAFLALILILAPVLQKEALQFQTKLPTIIDKFNASIMPRINEWLGTALQLDAATFKRLFSDHVSESKDVVSGALDYIKSGGLAVIGWLGTLLLMPVVVFYTLESWPALVNKFQGLIPRRYIKDARGFTDEIDGLLAQFLRGQLTVMLVLAAYYSIALTIAGFDVALPVGILTGLLVFIPYVGFGLGLLLALVSALLQFGNLYGLLAVAVIYGMGQVIESFVLTPRLVGEKIGLHPLVVIFALMAFGQLFGFVGVLIALPVSAVVAVALRYLHAAYLRSDFYKK